MSKQILENLFNGGHLTEKEAQQIIISIAKAELPATQVAAFLAVYRMRFLTVQELSGFRNGIFSLATRVDLGTDQAIDVCGTGGDGKNSLNVSTAVAFVVAGAGVAVAKHGNHGVSSSCGSSTVLEHLGIKFTTDQGELRRAIEKANLCFLHAPLFHPALKNVAPIRKELGVRTLFNNLGPLLNPASVKKQLLGVYSRELARLFRYYFQNRDSEVSIVHSIDGYDEVSLTSSTYIYGKESERVLNAKDFSLKEISPESLQSSGSVEDNARALVELLEGKGNAAYRSVVVANSALAIQLSNPKMSLIDAVAHANESINSGKAKRCFDLLRV